MKNTKTLKKNYEYRYILSNGKYYSGKYMEAFIKKNNSKTYNFLGIAIGVKIANAVKRNYIKRLIRENYKNIESYIKKGYSVVFLWKKKADLRNAEYENIQKDMIKIFCKAKMLEENSEYEKNINISN